MNCCKTSYTLCNPLPACLETLNVVKMDYIGQELTIKIVDKFDRIYSVTKTVDGSGNVVINLVDIDENTSADLPIGLLNEFAGFFKMYVYDSTGNEIKWTISGLEYDAIVFHLVNESPIETTYTLDPIYLQGVDGTF